MNSKIVLATLLILSVTSIISSVAYSSYSVWQSHQPFVFANFRPAHFLNYDDALEYVNFTIQQLEYIGQMDALDKGYTYLGYTFTIEKESYESRYLWSYYTVHFQWWAKK